MDRRGQSLLEFLFMLPLMAGLAVILVRVNTAIQVSIVSQQHARAQTLHLTMNSSTYPRLSQEADMAGLKNNQMVLGISDNLIRSGTINKPEATRQVITRRARGTPEPGDQEPDQTPVVRVRTTVSLCTQSNVIRVGGGYQPIGTATLTEAVRPQDFAYCRYGSSQGFEPKL